jgi:hypothetical protein
MAISYTIELLMRQQMKFLNGVLEDGHLAGTLEFRRSGGPRFGELNREKTDVQTR